MTSRINIIPVPMPPSEEGMLHPLRVINQNFRYLADAISRAAASGGLISLHAPTHKNGGTDPLKLNEFANPTGSVEFAQQQGVQFRFENRTSDPGSPAVGQVWLRTDL